MSNQEYNQGTITARIIDYKQGINVIQNISAVRIRSKDYVLLIMEDYAPTLGKVEGTIVLLKNDEEIKLEGITGYYKHQLNEFTILVEKEGEMKEESKA